MDNDDEQDSNRIPAVPATVALPVSVEQALAEWSEYQTLTQRLLDDGDYVTIQGKRVKKKSAWRKYARAFNISDCIASEEITRDGRGFPLYARIRVRATAPNGRSAEADHECHITERCCPGACGGACPRRGRSGHACCGSGCEGYGHWSHPGDLPAVATTRAKNRAISDLIGAGEVSAEEMPRDDAEARARSQAPRAAAQPHPPTGEGEVISEPQRKRAYAIGTGAGHTADQMREWLAARYGIVSSREIRRRNYEEICTRLADREALKGWEALDAAPDGPQCPADPDGPQCPADPAGMSEEEVYEPH